MYEQQLQEHKKAFENQQKQLAAMKKGGKSSKKAEEEMLNKMKNKDKNKKGKKRDADEDEPPPELLQRMKEYQVKFVFPPTTELAPPLLRLTNISFGYGSELLFKDLDFDVTMDSRIAIVGPNGVGKSTLLKLLYGKIQPVGSIY